MKLFFTFLLVPICLFSQEENTLHMIRDGEEYTIENPVANQQPGKFLYIEEFPQFNGDINSYFKANMHYPKEAEQKLLEGNVHVRFIIDTFGKVFSPIVIKTSDTIFNSEALRLVSQMPPWKPGKNGGRKVHVTFVLAVDFRLDQ